MQQSGRFVSGARVVAGLCFASMTLAMIAGCSPQYSTAQGLTATKASAATPSPTPSPKKKPSMPGDLKANELGRVPILMYHSVGEYNTKYDKHGLNITPATFRKHMELLHKDGFYPVNMRDVVEGTLDVPAGKTPVVLTFDDARGSQFRYRADGSIDPDCVIGILEECHRKWGDDWQRKAVFYVLPASKYNPTPFWQAGKSEEKIRFLADNGYEVANHSTSHRPLNRLSEKDLKWEVTFAQEYFKKISPKVTMDTMAVPYGIYPKTKAGRQLLLDNGNKCVLMAWGGASYAPDDKRFDRGAVLRIGNDPGEIERWIAGLVKARRQKFEGMRTYISDGDPSTLTVPQSMAKYLAKPTGPEIIVYNDLPPAKPKTEIKTAKKPITSG